jgi:2'-phosphotransferase
MAPGYPSDGQVISGMRGSCNLYIEIDMAKAMADGIKFYLSKNNVILSDGIAGTFDKVLKLYRNTSKE